MSVFVLKVPRITEERFMTIIRVFQKTRVDPRSQGRPLLPEEMESIRRILSRNLQNFNNKVKFLCHC